MDDDRHHPDLKVLVGGATDRRGRAWLERHLLICDSCWQIVRDDRRGRLLAEDLRETAPAALRDRIAALTEVSEPPRRERRRRRGPHPPRRLAAVTAVTATVLGAVGVLALRPQPTSRPSPTADPTVISEVARLAGSPGRGPTTELLGHGGQRASTQTVTEDGSTVIVARSTTAFPMPADAVPMMSTTAPWLARRGQVTLVCFNVPRPILVASLLPADRLVALAHQLDTVGS